ncbi:hypothetical protein [Antarcticirhabdus aurantiaca]|uniref:Uncharacterized protein n=1 Tax=Antarcticirhabdus aurantiaca TaxID=2606717 RepID=A0ACD4NW58_9HYPH|nr:hypothetical protein [Antarcticirhabdus aurantiaca]WAJ30996.1 hypothetical protein OXU80_12650 [Jeongeuplla avenae]
MTITIQPSGRAFQLDEHLERLKALVADIESLKVGGDPARLAEGNAVHIRGWSPSTRPVPCLRGTMEGHPSVRDGRHGETSDLWVWAPDHGVARTLSRWYTLGPSAIRGGWH